MLFKKLTIKEVFGDRYNKKDIDELALDLNEVLGLVPAIDINEIQEHLYIEAILYGAVKVNRLDSLSDKSWNMLIDCGLIHEHEAISIAKYRRPKEQQELPPSKQFKRIVRENRKLMTEIAFKPRLYKKKGIKKLEQHYYNYIVQHCKSGFTMQDIIKLHREWSNQDASEDAVILYFKNFTRKTLPNVFGGACIEDNGVYYVLLPHIKLTNKELEEIFKNASSKKKRVRSVEKTKPSNKNKKEG